MGADRADALDKVDKSNLSVTEQQKEETAKSKEHSDAEDKHEAEQGQLQEAKGKHDLAQTTLTAAQKAVDDSMAEIKSITEENEALLKMPKQVVDDTTAALVDAEAALQAAKTEQGRAESAKASAEAAVQAATKIVDETKATIAAQPAVDDVPQSHQEYSDAKSEADRVQRETDAATATHQRLTEELATARQQDEATKKAAADAEAAVIAAGAARDQADAELQTAREQEAAAEETSKQDLTAMEDAQKDAESTAADAETKLKLMNEQPAIVIILSRSMMPRQQCMIRTNKGSSSLMLMPKLKRTRRPLSRARQQLQEMLR